VTHTLSGASSDYQAKILAILQQNKQYPRAARRRKQEGTVLVEFVIASNGELLENTMIQSSGHSRLDDAAMKMLKSSAPFPPFPSDISQPWIRLQVPVVFNLAN